MSDEAPFALVADDEFLIRLDAVDILEQAGFRTLEAGDVDEALSLLSKHAGDVALLFTDVQMPGERNGFDLARETSRLYPDISILVASGAMVPAESELPEGAVFISKPFSAKIVQTRLVEILPDGQKPEPLKRKSGL